MRSDRHTALLALTGAGIIFGLTVPFSKLALEGMGPVWLTVARFALAFPVLALVARRTLRGAVALPVLGWGALFYGATIVVQNLGIATTSVSHAALILGSVPVLVALVALAAGRSSVDLMAWVGFTVALGGLVVLTGTNSAGDATPGGDALVLGSALLSALYIVAQPRLLAGRDAVAVTAVQMGSGTLAALPVALAFEGIPSAMPGSTALWGFAGLVVLGSVLPFALYAYGQARVAPEVAGAFVNLEPLVGAGLGALAFGDPFGPGQVGGAIALAAGIALSVSGGALREPASA